MTPRAKIITTVLLILGLASAGAADYVLTGRATVATVLPPEESPATGSGIMKQEGTDVPGAVASLGMAFQPSEDLTFLAQVSRDETPTSLALLRNNDRIGSVSWIDGDAKEAFIALKEALLGAFSSNVQHLSDRTIQEEGLPVVNILTFQDSALSEETLTFIRIRERLYEFHTASGAEAAMQEVMDTLTR